ncbi:MAG: PAS domain-containing protein [Pedobacter sp.]|nr:PAS domain-containing protein [Pedobacter sp.]
MLNFLRGISIANGLLLQESEISSCLQKVVEVLGQATQVDRCYIFTNRMDTDGKLKLYYTQEWCNTGIEAYLGAPELSGHTYDVFPGLYDTFINNISLFGLVKDSTNTKFKETMEMQGIQSYLFTPIFCDGNFWGWMGYDYCTHERNWEQTDVDVLFAVARNIGLRLHREQAEEKFKAAEDRLNLSISISKQGLWEWDLKTDSVIFSDYFAEMLGYEPEKFEQTYANWRSLVNPEDLDKNEIKIKEYLNKITDNYTVELRMRHKKGHEIWVKGAGIAKWDKDGTPLYMVGTQMDITELKTQQLVIEQQRNEYDHLINNLAEAVFRLNSKMEFSFINNYWLNISGYNKDESLHTSILDYIIEEDRDIASKCFHSLNNQQGKSTIQELRIKNKNGEIQWVQIIARRFSMNADNENSAIAGSIIDITNRKESEQKALELTELKSNFVTMASHQFRTPLTVIYSNIELLENYAEHIDVKIANRLLKLGKRIKSEINRMTDLMNNILLFGKYDSREPTLNTKPSDLSILCKRVINTYFSKQGDGWKVQFCSDDHVKRPVKIDELFFTYILTNIISNAFKYSEGEQNPEVSVYHKPDCVEIKVRDYGIGVPKDEINKLFDSFYRASNTSTIPGSGLGLVVAKQFMELHGGTIKLESKLGAGSIVILTFPYAET